LPEKGEQRTSTPTAERKSSRNRLRSWKNSGTYLKMSLLWNPNWKLRKYA